MEASIFKLVSIGKAAENLKRNSHSLQVLATEQAIGADGEINFDPQRLDGEYENERGETVQVQEIVSREIECLWLPNEDNRLTPPDVRRGELVEVWRMGDTDKYYWRSMGLRNDLRTLETVIYAWGATPELGGHQMDLTKCYMMMVSANDKHFTIRTSKANDEPFEYTIHINTKDAAVYIKDDDENYFELDSKDKRLQLKNNDGSFVKVERKKIDLQADEHIQLKVQDNVFKMTSDKTTLTTPDTVDIESGNSVNIKSGSLIDLTTSLLKAVVDKFKVI